MLEELIERTNRSSCDVMIFSTPLTRIVTPPNDDEARFRRIVERIGLRRTKMEVATITLIHQFNVTRANNKSSGMVATPSRTQSITPYMNRRIVQSTSRIQIGDLSKEKDDACTEHISRILLTLSTSPLECERKDVLIADIVSLTGGKRSLIVKRERLIFGFLQFLFDILIKPSRNCPAQSYLQESA